MKIWGCLHSKISSKIFTEILLVLDNSRVIQIGEHWIFYINMNMFLKIVAKPIIYQNHKSYKTLSSQVPLSVVQPHLILHGLLNYVCAGFWKKKQNVHSAAFWGYQISELHPVYAQSLTISTLMSCCVLKACGFVYVTNSSLTVQ